MRELDIEIDTDLRERAIQAVEDFVHGSGTPVSRSQMSGLLQVASKEPSRLKDFAGKQKERAVARTTGMREGERKAALQNEIDFWVLIKLLCEGKGPKCTWSLEQAQEAALPASLRQEKLPPGTALSKQQRDERERRKGELEAWKREWDREHYTAFFRHFCAHYMYHMPSEER